MNMTKKINNSKSDTGKMPSLKYQKSDFLTQLTKAGLGAVPFVGSLLSEVASSIIPNQRFDRVVAFAKKLEDKLEKLNKDFIHSQLADEAFVDVLEEGVMQAAKSVSDERREYIASIIANGLSEKEVEFSETRRFLKLLSELNDVEVIILRSYLVRTIGGDEVFREKHKHIIRRKPATMGSSELEKDKETILNNYKEHLVSLDLLEKEYGSDMRTNLPEFDDFTHGLKVRGYRLTLMGRLFLKQIGLVETTDNLKIKD